jgi:hypothetical protein
MMKPTPESIDLARGMMDEDNPFLVYLAAVIGNTMELNRNCVEAILNESREEFNSLGAGKAFENLEEKLKDVFKDFLNKEDES